MPIQYFTEEEMEKVQCLMANKGTSEPRDPNLDCLVIVKEQKYQSVSEFLQGYNLSKQEILNLAYFLLKINQILTEFHIWNKLKDLDSLYYVSEGS